MPKFQMYMARRATCHSSRCDIHNPFGQGGREQTDHHHQRHQKRGRQPQARTRIMRGRPNVLIEDLPADGGRRAIEWVVRRPIEAWEIVLDDPQSGRLILPVPAAGKEGGR